MGDMLRDMVRPHFHRPSTSLTILSMSSPLHLALAILVLPNSFFSPYSLLYSIVPTSHHHNTLRIHCSIYD